MSNPAGNPAGVNPQDASNIQQSYPPPPPWYTEFTSEEDATSRPPPPLPERTYTTFGWPRIAVQVRDMNGK